jgi:hypothetical protein
MESRQILYFLTHCKKLNFMRASKRVFICAALGVLATGGSVDAQQPPAAAPSITQAAQEKVEDFEKSFQILKRTAEIGDAYAQLKLGMMYAEGKGITRNSAEATIWFRRAAAQGRPEAAYQLGIQYEDGIGVAQDVWLAMYWFRRSAQSAYPDAQNAIGELYLGDKGIPTDYSEAIFLFHLAAESYNAQSMYNLGMRFALAQGVRHNLVKAYKWFEQSVLYAEPGSEQKKAARAREVIRKEMTPLQLYTALRIIHMPKKQRFFDRYSKAFYK